jgi:DNA gyrase subunit A
MSVTEEAYDLMIITKNGITIRMPIADIREAGRATQGVRLIRVQEGDEIAAVTKVMEAKEDEFSDEEAEGTAAEATEGTNEGGSEAEA